MKLSIGMIVKNEAKYLEKCLTALRPIRENVDSELIIVDTGSNDNTVEIAKKFTDKVFFHQWKDDFAEARNVTIDKSRGEWYFYIDADEILVNPESIIEFFNSGCYKRYASLGVQIKNLISENNFEKGEVLHSIRLAKRDKQLRFHSMIHEQLPIKEPIYSSDASINHYGYINTDKKFINEKCHRNLQILKKGIQKDQNNVFLLYHLSKTYSAMGNHMEALEPIEKAYNLIRNSKNHPMWIYNFMIDIYVRNGLYLKAEEAAIETLNGQRQETTANISTYFYLSQIQAVLKKNEKSIESYKEYLRLMNLYKEKRLSIDFTETIRQFEDDRYVYFQMSILYDGILDFENAFSYIKKALKLNSLEEDIKEEIYYNNAAFHMIELCLKHNRYNELIDIYKDISKYSGLEDEKTQKRKENKFIAILEFIIRDRLDYKEEIVNRFSELDMDNDYIFLNKLRKKKEREENFTEEDIKRILKIDFNYNLDVYGEFIYYLISEGISVENIMIDLDEKQINNYMEYTAHNFKDFSITIDNYFRKHEDRKDLSYCIFSKAFKRVILIKEGIDDVSYFNLFNRYIEEGIFYIEEVYKYSILDMESTYVLKNNEEAFFLYMRKAYKYKETDRVQYLQYLRKALNSYEYMKKGIEMLLEEETKEDKAEDNKQNEFEEYKNMIKKNINILLEANQIGEAKALIDEYLNIVPDDLEVLMLKSEAQLKLM